MGRRWYGTTLLHFLLSHPMNFKPLNHISGEHGKLLKGATPVCIMVGSNMSRAFSLHDTQRFCYHSSPYHLPGSTVYRCYSRFTRLFRALARLTYSPLLRCLHSSHSSPFCVLLTFLAAFMPACSCAHPPVFCAVPPACHLPPITCASPLSYSLWVRTLYRFLK